MRVSRLPYCPPFEGGPNSVIAQFCRYAREEVTSLGPDLDYDGPSWEVSQHVKTRSGRPVKGGNLSLVFCRRREHRFADALPLPPAIDPLTRAFLRTMLGFGIGAMERQLNAFRLIGEAMEEQGVVEVAGITFATLNEAIALATRDYSPQTAYSLGQGFAAIGHFLDRNGMVRVPLSLWRPPAAEPDPRTDLGTPEFAARASACKPSEAYMQALAAAYGLASEPIDILVTSAAGLMCCAPERINEVMALQENCEVWRTGPDGTRTLGIRFRGCKGSPDAVKCVGTAATPFAAECIARIRGQTSEGRLIKRWYDEYPAELYLGNLEFLRGRTLLEMDEVAAVLGLPSADEAFRYVRRHRLRADATATDRGRPAHTMPFAALERHVLAQLPRRSHDAGGADSANPLFIVPFKLFMRSKGWGPVPTMYEVVSHMHISRGLGKACETDTKSVFQRLGLDPERKLTTGTHSFRHYLSDLALRGGMSQADLALWSSRRFVKSNKAYDHISGADIRSMAATIDVTGSLLGTKRGRVA